MEVGATAVTHAQIAVRANAANSMRCSLSASPRLSSHKVSEANSAAASACVQKAISASKCAQL